MLALLRRLAAAQLTSAPSWRIGSDIRRSWPQLSINILICISYIILEEMALERINLNVPPEARRRLRAVAKRLKRTESEVARELLLMGLRQAERDAFYERVTEEMTPELRRRMIEIAEAFEHLDG
jgi:predicted DNA-binding protein